MDDATLLKRREASHRRRRRFALFGAVPVLALFLLGFLSQFTMMFVSDGAAEREIRAEMLRNLPFPEPADFEHDYTIWYEHHLNRTLVSLEEIPLTVPDQDEDAPLLLMEVRAGFTGRVVTDPPDHVCLTLTAAYPLILPEKTYARNPVQIAAGGETYRFRPDDFSMELATSRRSDETTVVTCDIPTEEFIAILQASSITGRAGEVSFTLPPDVHRAMLDFASSFNPGTSFP